MTAPISCLNLHLLGGFELFLKGQQLAVTVASQRLVAFLALHNRLLPRTYVAGVLWPEVPTSRANANLRAGLWRLPAACRRLVDQSAQHLRLTASVKVDPHSAGALAQRLLDHSSRCAETDLGVAARLELSAELLPTWYDDDDWVLVERERFHQLRLHALEALCQRLTAAGRFGEAVDAGLAAVVAEPLRESAHRVLIKAHLAEGNYGEANRQYQLCRRLLADELGIQPSPVLRELVSQRCRVPAGAITPRRDAEVSLPGLAAPTAARGSAPGDLPPGVRRPSQSGGCLVMIRSRWKTSEKSSSIIRPCHWSRRTRSRFSLSRRRNHR
jgi:DNA-binding SARP family transcriptional activator